MHFLEKGFEIADDFISQHWLERIVNDIVAENENHKLRHSSCVHIYCMRQIKVSSPVIDVFCILSLATGTYLMIFIGINWD